MKRLLAVVLISCLVVSGCGVVMSAKYANLLDQTTAMSAEVARRAETGQMTQDEMVRALKLQAETWAQFKAAREGREVKADDS